MSLPCTNAISSPLGDIPGSAKAGLGSAVGRRDDWAADRDEIASVESVAAMSETERRMVAGYEVHTDESETPLCGG
jgi:hypothetical protein